MKEDFSEEDGVKAAELEGEFATMNGWEAESDAGWLQIPGQNLQKRGFSGAVAPIRP